MNEDTSAPSPLLDTLNAQLAGASLLLDGAAASIMKSELERPKNVRRIAEALSKVIEIQSELYELEPRLIPLFLRDAERWKPYFDGS